MQYSISILVVYVADDKVTEEMLVTHFLIQPDPVGVKLQGWSEKPFRKHINNILSEKPFHRHLRNMLSEKPFRKHLRDILSEKPFRKHMH